MTNSPRSLREWFDLLIDVAPAERERRIEQDIDDADMRSRLRALFAADATPPKPIAATAPERLAAALDAVAPAALPSGARFGGYVIDRWLGDGGSASVYRAHRLLDGVAQTVALKLLRRGLGAADARLQFDRERRALAQLDHPGIARLIDGGVADDGQGYLVLEFVDGRSITDYAAAHTLSLRDRLRLMIDAAQAVAAAHRALIVHRDIKPGNVMVTPEGRVKLLDFGIAKLLGEDDSTRTAFRVFTPAYAAPEQREGGPVTTATDVFALGVLLGELLTGRRLGDGDTTTPSQRIDEHAAPGALPEPPARLRRSLRGDLDNILLKAMALEPERRYESAVAFADDLERALDGRPVAAHPPSRGYRLAKFVRRHRAAVVVGAVASLAVLAVAGVAIVQAERAREQAREAEAQAQRANAVSQFLSRLFLVSETGKPRAEVPTTEQLLADAAKRISRELTDSPRTRIELSTLIGRIQTDLGLYDAAEPLLVDAIRIGDAHLPDTDPLRIDAHRIHAKRELAVRRYDASIAELQAVVAVTASVPSALAFDALIDLAEAEAKADRVAASRASAARAAEVLRHLDAQTDDRDLRLLERRADNELHAKEYAAAEPLTAEHLALTTQRFGRTHARTLDAAYAHAEILLKLGRNGEAEQLAQSAVADLDAVFAKPNDFYVQMYGALAAAQFRLGKLDESAATLERMRDFYRSGVSDPSGEAALLTNLASIHLRQLRNAEALPLVDAALTKERVIYGPQHTQVATTLKLRGQILARLKRFAEADAAYLEALGILSHAVGEDNVETLKMQLNRADLALRRNDAAAALALLDAIAPKFRAALPADHRDVVETELWRARALTALGRYPEALPVADQALHAVRRNASSLNYLLPRALTLVGEAQRALGRRDEARATLTEALQARREEKPPQPEEISALERSLGQLRRG